MREFEYIPTQSIKTIRDMKKLDNYTSIPSIKIGKVELLESKNSIAKNIKKVSRNINRLSHSRVLKKESES